MISKKNLFLQYLAQTSGQPPALEIVQGRGSYLKDRNNKRYIDLISGISVSSMGHNHPAIKRAIQKQLKNNLHIMVYGEFVVSSQVEYARLLVNLLPEDLQQVFFVNSGSEAIEGALKLAKKYTGKTEIIAMQNAYHGSTHGALSLMSNSYFSDAFRPLLPGVKFIRFNDLENLDKISHKTAAVIVEPVQGEAGYIPANLDYLKKLREITKQTETLLIFDEIQTAIGRTGSFFALEHYGVSPDILVLAKSLGGGLPLGAFISSEEIMKSLSQDPILGHITTFGGNPLCCEAGRAFVKSLKKEKILDTIADKEKLFRQSLVHDKILEISGKGLMLAVHLENFDFCLKVIEKCYEKGLISDWFLFNDKALRISPPLNIERQTINKACKIIIEALNEVE